MRERERERKRRKRERPFQRALSEWFLNWIMFFRAPSTLSLSAVHGYLPRFFPLFFPSSFVSLDSWKKRKKKSACKSELEKRAEKERVDKERCNSSGGFLRRRWQETATGFSSLGNYSRLFGLAVFVSRCKCRDGCTLLLSLSSSATRASSSANDVQVFSLPLYSFHEREIVLSVCWYPIFPRVERSASFWCVLDVIYRACWLGILSFFLRRVQGTGKNL